MSVWAILVAAGRGERLGLDRPKAFAKLGDEPLLAEPLRRLEACPWVDGVVLVAPPGWEEAAILVAGEGGCGKGYAGVTGGETKSDSGRGGLAGGAAGLGGACDPRRRGGGLRQGVRVRDGRRDEERFGAGGSCRGACRRARRPRPRRCAPARVRRGGRAGARAALGGLGRRRPRPPGRRHVEARRPGRRRTGDRVA